MVEGQVKVATLADLRIGQCKGVQVGGEDVCLVNAGGIVYALSDTCTHAGCSLAEYGQVDGEELECTCHYSRFLLATGEVTSTPAREPLRHFVVRVEGSDIWIVAP